MPLFRRHQQEDTIFNEEPQQQEMTVPSSSPPAYDQGSDIDEKSSAKDAHVEAKAGEAGFALGETKVHPLTKDDIEALDREGDFKAFDPFAGKPFSLEELGGEEEGNQFTLRAVLLGSVLGLLIAASNVYLGLKTGFTFGASLFGAILGFAGIQLLQVILPPKWGGAPSGPRETCTIQSTATAAGGLSGAFVAAIPAMYQLNLLGANAREDFGRLITFTIVSAFYGCFFAVPLRGFFVRRLKLVFPSPTATAITIKGLHSVGGARRARQQTIILGVTFMAAMVWCVINQYVMGILYEWHWGYWLYQWGWKKALVVDNWNWYFQTTPAFTGAGMLAGLNASFSFLFGAILLWGIIGPALIQTGQANGRVLAELEGVTRVSYTSLSWKPGQDLNTASPRYWGLWVGVLMMFAASFAELAMNGPAIYRGVKAATVDTYNTIRRRPLAESADQDEDDVPPSQQTPLWMWGGGLILSVVFTCVVASVQFDLPVGISILAIVLAFLFSFVALQASGTTDTNPLGVIAKGSQLIVGGALRGVPGTMEQHLLSNLIAGSIVSSAGQHSVDMVGDLKTGHLLRARPRTQFYAQLAGSIPGIFLSPGLFVLFSTAYPCITDPELLDTCSFGLPAVTAWVAVARAVLSEGLPVSKSCGITALCFAFLAIFSVIARYLWIPKKYHIFVPNWNAVGLGFVIPQTYIPVAMCTGAILSWAWQKRRPEQYDLAGYAVAAGFIAGEGIAGVINAILTIAGVSGDVKGTMVGYPSFS
ncbi:hypothetical protein OC834_000469 [Tilletia horrida]|uniref:Oligopeptide transporter n=1 Tax=Tilletia horrida TaxID=155126 RepID=A0AAN6GFD0_9BASI|nr:hypothetical protein OC842_001598 [Tilletia horrida]KAK0538321.1 hypothetical protein OC834_000469 [Tilletia horrida]